MDVSALPADDRPGAEFELVGELGRGSSSVVYLARQRSLGRDVALKRLLRSVTGDADTAARLRREGQVIARLEHPGIVRLYDLFIDGADLVLVMEYVHGSSVQSLMATSSLLPSQALVIVSDVAAALDHAAQRGVVHRDIKPANVLVTTEGRAKLGDFGLARIASDQSLFATSDGRARGTPLYMSPELLRGEPPSPESDVYALALMTLELLAGGHPFSALSVRGAVEAHLDGGARRAVEGAPLPRKVADVLRQGLSVASGDRPSAAVFIDGVRRAAPAAWLRPEPMPGLGGSLPDIGGSRPAIGGRVPGDGPEGATRIEAPAAHQPEVTVTSPGGLGAASGPGSPAPSVLSVTNTDPAVRWIRPEMAAPAVRPRPSRWRLWGLGLAVFAVVFAVVLGALELVLH